MDVVAFYAISEHNNFDRYPALGRSLQVIFILFLALTPLLALPIESSIHFIDVTDSTGIHFKHANGASGEFHLHETLGAGGAFLDYDNDGDTDLLVTQLNGTVTLLRNENKTSNNWIRLKLIGTRSNRDGIGTRITLTIGTESQTREVHVGYSYLSSNDPTVRFGVAERTLVDRIKIRWQSGVVQVLENLAVNQELVVTEPLSNK